MDGVEKQAILYRYQQKVVSEDEDVSLRLRFVGESLLSTIRSVVYAACAVFAAIGALFCHLLSTKSDAADASYWMLEFSNRTSKNLLDAAAFCIAVADPKEGLSWAVENSLQAAVNTGSYKLKWCKWKTVGFSF